MKPQRFARAVRAPFVLLTGPLILSLAACEANRDFERAERGQDPGVVEKVIRHGMSSQELEQALGKPSFVTEDDEHHVEWTYHKYARGIEVAPDGSYKILAFKNADAVKKSRKRISIVVTLDSEKKVYEVSHRTRIVDYPVD
jgi:hypothetical protein